MAQRPESKRRSVAKSVSYRVICIISLFCVTYILTRDLAETTTITIIFQTLQTALYYLHERSWAGYGGRGPKRAAGRTGLSDRYATALIVAVMVAMVAGAGGFWLHDEGILFPSDRNGGHGHQEPSEHNLTAEQAHALIENRSGEPGFVILDLRDPLDFRYEHIQGAQNLYYYADDFEERLDELPKNATYLIYCEGGFHTQRTWTLMNEFGFEDVYALIGGIEEWKSAGYMTVGS